MQFKLYPGAAGRVMRSGPVRAALRDRAERIGARAELIATDTNYEFQHRIVEGVRPKGRPYATVQSDDAAQEFGTWGKKRRRILGRAAAEER